VSKIIKSKKTGVKETMNKFEEYKLFIESTDRFSDRRQKVSNTYLTANSIIIGAIAFLTKDAGLETDLRIGVIIITLLIGIIACTGWKYIIYKYKKLVGFRIDELREMEKHPAMKDCHRMYHAEDKLYPRDENNQPIEGEALNISDKEAWLPNVFLTCYSLGLIGLILYWLITICKTQ